MMRFARLVEMFELMFLWQSAYAAKLLREEAQMFPGFGSAISAVGQARAMGRLAKLQRDIVNDEMQKLQDLAYDAERWPHCIDLPAERK